jgi:hypothetical protein
VDIPDAIWTDYSGRRIRVPGERIAHVHQHRELIGHETLIEATLAAPDIVVISRRDPNVILYQKRFPDSPAGNKHLCAAVRLFPDDAFLMTAFLTDRRKRGMQIWPQQ